MEFTVAGLYPKGLKLSTIVIFKCTFIRLSAEHFNTLFYSIFTIVLWVRVIKTN